MYKNYIFDLYGTLIDINTDEWQAKLWKSLQILYSYHGAQYTPQEIKREYGRLVEKEKAAVHRRHPEFTVIDIKIEKVFKALFTQKGVKATKSRVEFIAEAFRCYSTKYIKLYDGVLDLLDTLKAHGKKIYLLSNAQRVFTENELKSRTAIMQENYNKTIHIEALTMIDMVNRDILPAVMGYVSFLADAALKKEQLGIAVAPEKMLARTLSGKTQLIVERVNQLSASVDAVPADAGCEAESHYYHDVVVQNMESLRSVVDETELMVSSKYWPYPSYGEMLFGVR